MKIHDNQKLSSDVQISDDAMRTLADIKSCFGIELLGASQRRATGLVQPDDLYAALPEAIERMRANFDNQAVVHRDKRSAA